MDKILIVDDEKEISDLIEVYLKNDGFKVFKAYGGEKALVHLKNNPIDLAIIDLMMPGINGFELCNIIRKEFNFPIIMLTAKDRDMDKIQGLSIGADDYITKPFQPLELLARVKAQIRRYKRYNVAYSKENIISIRDMDLDLDSYTCSLNNTNIDLTPTEFAILKLLAQNKGKVLTTDNIFKTVWKEKYYENQNNTLMVHIRHIRQKLKDSGPEPKYIKTVWGVGYKIEE